MLDIDHGTYPYVTSSSPTIGGAFTGSGVFFRPDRIIGIQKAYITRVGGGPFPTEFVSEDIVKSRFPSQQELDNMKKTMEQWEREKYDKEATLDAVRNGDAEALSRYYRIQGGEYGTTAGRPRRCGHIDLVVARYAKRLNGITEIILTKLDVLSGLPELHVCTRYKLDGKDIDYFPSRIDDLKRCEPVLDRMKGWERDISNAKTFCDLPTEAVLYVNKIRTFLDIPLSVVSVGPERIQTII